MTNAFPYLSDAALVRRRDRIRALQMVDKTRFRPNPLGAGYLTREERYNELLLRLNRAIEDRLGAPHR